MTPKLRIFLWLPILVVALDQLTKWWVVQNVELGVGSIPVIDGFFWITHVLNTGIVFGWLRDGSVLGFLLLTLVAIALVVSFFRQLPPSDVWSAAALALILGGAIGNGIDRLVRGAVVDFLRFNLGLFNYPDFNVADSAIVIGVAILLLAPQTWRQLQEEPAGGPEPELPSSSTRAPQQDPG